MSDLCPVTQVIWARLSTDIRARQECIAWDGGTYRVVQLVSSGHQISNATLTIHGLLQRISSVAQIVVQHNQLALTPTGKNTWIERQRKCWEISSQDRTRPKL
jgi:hypothetical protein